MQLHLPPFSCVACAEIFALRPLTQKQKDLACLSFFFNCLVFPLLVLNHYVECGPKTDRMYLGYEVTFLKIQDEIFLSISELVENRK